MSLEEKSGRRDLSYSKWHRPDSIGRFVGGKAAANRLSMFDIDAVELCAECNEPLAIFELVQDHGQPMRKSTYWLEACARRMEVEAYLVFYRVAEDGDVVRFTTRRLLPEPSRFKRMTPAGYAAFLVALRRRHAPDCLMAVQEAA